jgi:type IV pilus assembly protein PilV
LIARPHHQSGVLLLEVLIALLIFALGVLGLVGLQATAIKQSSQTKFRADATLLANELIGQMWVSTRTPAALNLLFTSSAGGGTSYQTWYTKITSQNLLPGADTCPPLVAVTATSPLDAIVAGASAPATGLLPSAHVVVTMRWIAPGENLSCSQAHNLVLTNQIK